jgi:hypothetical protein
MEITSNEGLILEELIVLGIQVEGNPEYQK